ncbi:serine hydrolase domain-containing protein [Flavobacterium subsaxonicum]|uniref:serine hydrolase domain-containing protein n=1 Tax=Flavobacterium subsaxonicum TaxID=426226 RepID=UPI00040CFAEF|nr:serine hydrolase domain-containing protein [Flavobacterium subsaxonicum]
MKTLLYALFFMFTVTAATAQDDVYKTVVEQIKTRYNNVDYAGVYSLLSPRFKEQQTEQQFAGLLNSFSANGQMLSAEFAYNKDGFRVYKTTFDGGVFGMFLACTPDGLVDGFILRPFVEKVERKGPILKSNKRDNPIALMVDKLVVDFMKDPHIVGVTLVVTKDNRTEFYYYGEAEKNSAQLPKNTTVYEIGSISKTFTATLLAQAVIDKKLLLDDDIRNYLPAQCANLTFNGKPILIKHLANHTSGIPRMPDDFEKHEGYDENDPYKNYTAAMYYNYLSKLKLAQAPGTAEEYSNTGVAVLGLILEKAYGQPYQTLLATYITNPLKMSATFVDVPAAQAANFVTGYNDGLETPHWDFGGIPAAGGIRSNIQDMATYLNANLKDATPAMQLAHKPTFTKNKLTMGLAWVIQNTKAGNTVVWHNGGTGGFSSYIGYIKEKQCGVVVLTNTYSDETTGLGNAILKILE